MMHALLFFSFLHLLAFNELDPAAILKRMETVYQGVEDYQAQVVEKLEKEGSSEIQRFLYTFKKPRSIRLDFISPRAGLIVVYPDKKGKAVVQLPGVANFIKLHLSPDHRLLGAPTGQRIDQTDMGLLINNIGRSLTEQRRGPAEISRAGGTFQIRVLAEDHFRRGVITLYRFLVDDSLWLPIGVEESTPDGRRKRTVTFQDLRTNIGVSDHLFQLGR
jgi:hypothetical protein